MEQRWLAVAVMILVAMSLLSAVVASQLITVTNSNIIVSRCSSGSVVYGITTTTLNCTTPPQTASVIRLTTTCSTSSTSYINCTGFGFIVPPNEVATALVYESFSITTTVSANFLTQITLPSGASVLNACYQYLSPVRTGDVNTCNTNAGVSFNPHTNAEELLTIKYVLSIGSSGGSVQIQLASGNSRDTAKIYNQSVIFVNYS